MKQNTQSSLSPARKRLVLLMQRINFGRLEHLPVQNGEPSFDDTLRVYREVKFCAENGPRPEVALSDFTLRTQVIDLFNEIDRVGNGVIESLSIKHGLPFGMSVEQTE